MFAPFRCVGVFTDGTPLRVHRLGGVAFAVAPVGRAFQVFRVDSLTLASVSPPLDAPVGCVEAVRETVFAACGSGIRIFERVTEVGRLEAHHGEVTHLLALGDDVLVSAGEDRRAVVWLLGDRRAHTVLELDDAFDVTVLMHPDTYLNKVLLAAADGRMQLWNVSRGKLVYEFPGWGAAVTAVEQSPVVDVVAVGLADGRVVLHNLRADQTVCVFRHAASVGAVRALSFRTVGDRPPVLASAGESGEIAVWGLDDRQLVTTLREAHDGAVSTLHFLPGEPLLLSAGEDNAVKVWIFDHGDGSARLLRSRQGHSAPPRALRYYGGATLATLADGSDGRCCQILSAGQDRAFRVFHTVREQQSTELSQGHVAKRARQLSVRPDSLKLAPIVAFAASETRERDWANVVTCHEGSDAAYVWNFDRRALGKHALRPSPAAPAGARATCVAISVGGHYAVVGMSTGALFRYNLQSGKQRGAYPQAAGPAPVNIRGLLPPGVTPPRASDYAGTAAHAHAGGATGVAVDGANRWVVSAGLDARLKWWGFKTCALEHEERLSAPAARVELSRDSGLLAVACDDLVVRLFDVPTRKLVRRFAGHTHRIADMTFSPDGRWLVTAALDCGVRVFDLPTGRLVDWMTFPDNPVTGVTMSLTGEFLATAHVDSRGVHLWSNRSFYSSVFVDGSPTEGREMSVVGALAEGGAYSVPSASDVVASAGADVVEEDDAPLAPGAATLSTLPRGQWHTLFNLELIKARNKPVEPAKAAPAAPFFLPTPGMAAPAAAAPAAPAAPMETDGDGPDPEGWGDFGGDDAAWGDDAEWDSIASQGGSRLLRSGGRGPRCALGTLLERGGDADEVMAFLKQQSASAVDVELRSLCTGPEDAEGVALVGALLPRLEATVRSRRDFQVVQAYLARALRVHAATLAAVDELKPALRSLKAAQDEAWTGVQDMMASVLCLVGHFGRLQ